jgi:AAA family ATP:ADP antiporter
MNRALVLLQKAVDVRPEEVRALLFACLFNFVILGSYYVIRPIRDDIAAAGGIENLSWLFTGTLVTMLIANAAFSAIVARMPRRRFLPIAYRFFIANLIVFYLLMRFCTPAQNVWVGRAFYVWVSVFNLFVVTLFWAFMTDIFNSEQAKRLFAFIAVGGSLGAIAGPIVTASLVQKLGAPNLILVTAALLEIAPWCVKVFPAEFRAPPGRIETGERKADEELTDPEVSQRPPTERGADQVIGGGVISGIAHVFRSPYLLGICAFMLLHAITSTIVYFQQADITGHQFHDRALRTAFFAQLDLTVNSLTIIVQLLLTGRLLKWFGVGCTLAFLPVLSIFGFLGMGLMPVLAILAVFQVLRRAGNFAVTRPAREVLFTVLTREDKYKAKSFIDTFVYRAGDQIGAWSYPLLTWLGLGLTGISFVAAPLAAIWCGLSIWLGKKQAALANKS